MKSSWRNGSRMGPWKEDVREGLLLLVDVVQPTKNKVRPVLDYQELDKHVSCHTGGDFIDVCGKTLRRWRQKSVTSTIVDVKSAYLHTHIAPHLWKYQLVSCKERTYYLSLNGY